MCQDQDQYESESESESESAISWHDFNIFKTF